MQEWINIPGYENYQVNSKGIVRNTDYHRQGIVKEIKQSFDIDGYVVYVLCKNSKARKFKAHKLVMLCFVGERKNGMVINHINGIKNDNRLENLEYCTLSYNVRHAYDNGLIKAPCKGKLGFDSKNGKRINQYSKEGDLIKMFGSSLEIKRELGFDSSSIIKCCKGKLKTVKGYIFRYANGNPA